LFPSGHTLRVTSLAFPGPPFCQPLTPPVEIPCTIVSLSLETRSLLSEHITWKKPLPRRWLLLFPSIDTHPYVLPSPRMSLFSSWTLISTGLFSLSSVLWLAFFDPPTSTNSVGLRDPVGSPCLLFNKIPGIEPILLGTVCACS